MYLYFVNTICTISKSPHYQINNQILGLEIEKGVHILLSELFLESFLLLNLPLNSLSKKIDGIEKKPLTPLKNNKNVLGGLLCS